MKYYETSEESYDFDIPITLNEEEEFGCGFCWDKKKRKNKELFFLDRANNMRVCEYCPYCGRPLN